MLLLTGTGPYAYRLEEEAAQVRRGELGTVLLSQRRVSKFLREVGALEDPRLRGKALTANKSGLWRWRVGDYRIIADIVDAHVVVVVVDVGHRSKVYD
ncbi:type II toxin-antitoxin system RelE family toxin [Corynebacterium diphtheriae]|uniref:type II toxin-antitoxin system RelE family toxin n=1 Tax=Corynebacterium diphtheriae TaxID=1717 RepID=UPI0015F361E0|nr:type II toxin-antitoxin system mRNA interferase toxin, RelE/StbE family [Corynebacterium diphtheriae]